MALVLLVDSKWNVSFYQDLKDSWKCTLWALGMVWKAWSDLVYMENGVDFNYAVSGYIVKFI